MSASKFQTNKVSPILDTVIMRKSDVSDAEFSCYRLDRRSMTGAPRPSSRLHWYCTASSRTGASYRTLVTLAASDTISSTLEEGRRGLIAATSRSVAGLLISKRQISPTGVHFFKIKKLLYRDKPRDAFVQIQWRGWSLKTRPSSYVEFSRSMSKGTGISTGEPQNSGVLSPSP